MAPKIIPRSKSLRSHFFPILTAEPLEKHAVTACFYAFSCCHMFALLTIYINKVYTRSIPVYLKNWSVSVYTTRTYTPHTCTHWYPNAFWRPVYTHIHTHIPHTCTATQAHSADGYLHTYAHTDIHTLPHKHTLVMGIHTHGHMHKCIHNHMHTVCAHIHWLLRKRLSIDCSHFKSSVGVEGRSSIWAFLESLSAETAFILYFGLLYWTHYPWHTNEGWRSCAIIQSPGVIFIPLPRGEKP